MNLKQKNLLKTVGKSRTAKEAMLKAGYSPTTADKQPKRTLEAKSIQEKIQAKDEKALRRYDEAFDANKVISAKIVNTEANEQTDDFIEVPDHATRLKAVDMHFKARGVYNEGTTNLTQINIGGDMGIVVKEYDPNNPA